LYKFIGLNIRNHIKTHRKEYKKFPIYKEMLEKYTRQYVGYLTQNNEIIIEVNIFNKKKLEGQNPIVDIVPLLGNGYCCIQLNIVTKEVSGWMNEIKQNAEFVKGKGYEGYIFPKECSLLGIPPQKNRYTPSVTDIEVAEKTLKEYMKLIKKEDIELPIDKKMLEKYTRQYVGYLTNDSEIIVRINLFDNNKLEYQNPALDIISLMGYCCIQINITTKKVSEWTEIIE
jgi:hypothetical protein